MSITHKQWYLPIGTDMLDSAVQSSAYCEQLEFVWLEKEDIYSKSEKRFADDMLHAKKGNILTGEIFEFDKSWDALFFCLSKHWRKSGVKPYDIYGIAIFGELEVNTKTKTVQGFEIRYLRHKTLDGIIKALECVSFEHFVNAIADPAWETVYGARFYDAKSCWGVFSNWKAFLQRAQQNNYHVICVTS